eukprot:13920949-Alexandrium_andersonii.AAC.2
MVHALQASGARSAHNAGARCGPGCFLKVRNLQSKGSHNPMSYAGNELAELPSQAALAISLSATSAFAEPGCSCNCSGSGSADAGNEGGNLVQSLRRKMWLNT